MLKEPMLAGKASLNLLRFPLLGSVKYDGIRAVAIDGVARSRKMLVHPNLFIQKWFADHPELHGSDGEIIVGLPNAEDVCRVSGSGVSTITGEPDFRFYVFDRWDMPRRVPYLDRMQSVRLADRVVLVNQVWLQNIKELEAFEERTLDLGYEGVILRDPKGLYKEGRSTPREGGMLKVKRFDDAEATIVRCVEREHNGNEATISATGRTKRSSHQENKSGLDTLGAFDVVGLTAFEGIEFRVGKGAATDAECQHMWNIRDKLVGKTITFKYFPVGCKDKPRHPGFKTIRMD